MESVKDNFHPLFLGGCVSGFIRKPLTGCQHGIKENFDLG
jgi:hypothetical protein